MGTHLSNGYQSLEPGGWGVMWEGRGMQEGGIRSYLMDTDFSYSNGKGRKGIMVTMSHAVTVLNATEPHT